MKLTPAMQQYMDIKNKHPDTIVLFRMGDFYETFYEDAKTAARELNIVLTARGKGDTRAPLAGIPYHSLDQYLAKLIKKGYKVTIVEQLEDPKQAKGIVKRGVVRIVTPGTVMDSNILDDKSNNYIMSIVKSDEKFGVSIADISTGEFVTTFVNNYDELVNEIARYQPRECILPLSLEDTTIHFDLKRKFAREPNNISFNVFDDRHFWKDGAYKLLLEHFNTQNLLGYGLSDKESAHDLAICSSGALLSYLKTTQKNSLVYVNKISLFNINEFMVLDEATQRNLELVRNIRDNSSKSTLLEVLDTTVSSMGSRQLRSWLLKPLIKIDQIQSRQEAIEVMFKNSILRDDVREELSKVADIERLISRVNYGTANARDLVGIKNALRTVSVIKKLLGDVKDGSVILSQICEMLELEELAICISNSINEEAGISVRDGNMIKDGYDTELDKLRGIRKNSKKFIADLEEKEKKNTGIKSLKIKFNRVFGYYIEVTKSNLHLVPKHYIRKQTQVNSERFITEELKEQESLILNSEEKIKALEYDLFMGIVNKVSENTTEVQQIASKFSLLDVVCCLAKVAAENEYVRPEVNEDGKIVIKDGRHPVVEKIVDKYVANDSLLQGNNKIQIITGPNMSGKSSYMRQVALIVLMTQIGSFIPAKSVEIGVVDRIFTRVGAYDDLTHGQSTFMVEMNETANILNNATEKSLVILDEIGRGTSTFDGISIAWAVAEYLHDKNKSKTLFATHYHQLNKLAEHFPDIKNYNIAVLEKENDIVFLRKIVSGGTDKSYGIHVAKLAGMPETVLKRSVQIMQMLEVEDEIGDRIEQELKSKDVADVEVTKEEISSVVDRKNKEKQKSLLEVT
jgi:DNA mismatch repair protein MutS